MNVVMHMVTFPLCLLVKRTVAANDGESSLHLRPYPIALDELLEYSVLIAIHAKNNLE